MYAAAGRQGDEAKRRTALRLIAEMDFGISVQVLQEFYVAVTTRVDIPMPPAQALLWIEQLEMFPCLMLDTDLVKIATELSERYQISYWDAAIAAAANALGARTLYSEDLSDGQLYDSVQVRNPFRIE